jgi:hypothetical protein
MKDFDIKATICTALTASGVLAITIVLSPLQGTDAIRAGAVLCLFGCGLLTGMCWQLLICRNHDSHRGDKER